MILFKAIDNSWNGVMQDLYFETNDIIKFLLRLSPSLNKGLNLMTGKIGLFPFDLVKKVFESDLVENGFIVTKNYGKYVKGDIILDGEVREGDVHGFLSSINHRQPIIVPLTYLISLSELPNKVQKKIPNPTVILTTTKTDESQASPGNSASSTLRLVTKKSSIEEKLNCLQISDQKKSQQKKINVSNRMISNVDCSRIDKIIKCPTNSKNGDGDENIYEEECIYLEEHKQNSFKDKLSESLEEGFYKRELRIKNDLKFLMDDMANIKEKLSLNNSDPEYVRELSNNLAFLKEEYKEKQKQMTNVKEHKERLLSAQEDIAEEMYDCYDSDEDGIRNNYDTRCRIFEEILETEKKFINDLRLTLEIFDLSTMQNKISRQEYNILFEDLNAVIAVAQSFYEELSQSVKTHGYDICIGSIFLKHVNSFETVYKEYCINYDHKLEILQKKSRSPEIEDFLNEGLKKMTDKGTQISSLDSMLVKPLQRFLKYSLFIKTIIKNTNEGHVDMIDLKSASIEFERIALKINEKKRFEELRTEIFDRSDQWHHKTLHAIKKGPQRLFATSLYGAQQNDDTEYIRAVSKFEYFRKRVSLFQQIVVILKNNLKDVVVIYSSISDNLREIICPESGSELTQYLNICRQVESNYCKTYILKLEGLVIVPLTKLLDLFSGPTLLIKKRKSTFLDYMAIKEKSENKECFQATRAQLDRKEELKSKFSAINNTLKEELPILVAKSKVLFDECINNYDKMSAEVINDCVNSLRTLVKDLADDKEVSRGRTQMNILAQMQHTMVTINGANNFHYLGLSTTNRPTEQLNAISRSESYFQTDEDVSGIKMKFKETDIAFVKKDFIPTKPHQIRVEMGNIVGVVKRSDPKGNSSSWLIEVCPKRIGFVPNSHLNPVSIVNRRQSCSTLPRSFHSTVANQAQSMNNINLMQFAPESPAVCNQRVSCDELFKEVRTALYDYKSTRYNDISMTKNDRLILIEAHDLTGNKDWSLVTNMTTGLQGYVPSNYISPGDLR